MGTAVYSIAVLRKTPVWRPPTHPLMRPPSSGRKLISTKKPDSHLTQAGTVELGPVPAEELCADPWTTKFFCRDKDMDSLNRSPHGRGSAPMWGRPSCEGSPVTPGEPGQGQDPDATTDGLARDGLLRLRRGRHLPPVALQAIQTGRLK